jgi:hypothetical protein
MVKIEGALNIKAVEFSVIEELISNIRSVEHDFFRDTSNVNTSALKNIHN